MAKSRLKIIPLGGLSEIGKNMMVLEFADELEMPVTEGEQPRGSYELVEAAGKLQT